MVSDDSLPDLDDSYFDIYSTKRITSTYYGFLEKLKSDNNASGNKTIVSEKDKEENHPCSSKDTRGNHFNLNDPCTSKDTNRRRIDLNDPCTSKDTNRRRIDLNYPCTSKDTNRRRIDLNDLGTSKDTGESYTMLDDPCTSTDSSGSSIILDDSSGSTIIVNDQCTENEPSRSSNVLEEENDLEVISDNSNDSTPSAPFSRTRLRRRTGRRRGRGRGRGRGTATATGRGRGRSARSSGSRQDTSEVEIIDLSPVPKRRRPQIPEIIVLSDDDDFKEPSLTLEDEINYEVSVKVLWMSVTVKTFPLRRFQKFTSVFEYFMKEENVPYEKVLLKLRGNRISKNDTPDSLDLKVCDFIDGGILSEAVLPIKKPEPVKRTTNDENCLTIKLQDKTKIAHRLTINKGEMLKLLMVKYAEQTEIPLKNLKFYYDGDLVSPSDTPESLGMSTDEIIDVKY